MKEQRERAMKSWFMAEAAVPETMSMALTPIPPTRVNSWPTLKSVVDNAAGFGTLMQMFKADDYRNRTNALFCSCQMAGDRRLGRALDGS